MQVKQVRQPKSNEKQKQNKIKYRKPPIFYFSRAFLRGVYSERLVFEILRLVFYFVVLESARDFLNLCRQRHCIALAYPTCKQPSGLHPVRTVNWTRLAPGPMEFEGDRRQIVAVRNIHLVYICRNCSKANRMPTMCAIPQLVSA